jgi:hypothetical protein
MASLAVTMLSHALAPRDDKQTYQSVKDYRDHCTLATCPLDDSFWAYRPSLAANSFFLALFSLSTVLFIGQAFNKRFVGFSIAMISGCILEILGYIGRVMSYHNPFVEV